MTVEAAVPTTETEWRKALDELPSLEENEGKIPSFFFGHGQPSLVWPAGLPARTARDLGPIQSGPNSLLPRFLQDFGKTLLKKYNPKAVVVFSAHWETRGERLVTDYGDSNPLLYDYYNFPRELYDVKYESRGDHAISQRVVELFKEAGIRARLTSADEPRGRSGHPTKKSVASGFDHGVFIPFIHMFPNPTFPIVEVSMDSDYRPEAEWKIGKAVDKLRGEGVLVLSGGLTIHTFQDAAAWKADTAAPEYLSWEKAIHSAILSNPTPESRKKALFDLVNHAGFRFAQPQEDHFVPIYLAGGAADEKGAKLITGLYGAPCIAFGV